MYRSEYKTGISVINDFQYKYTFNEFYTVGVKMVTLDRNMLPE